MMQVYPTTVNSADQPLATRPAIEATQFAPFAMEHLSARRAPAELPGQPAIIDSILAAAALIWVSWPLAIAVPAWFYATWLGTTLGVLVVTSARLTWNIGRIANTSVLALIMLVAHCSLMHMTLLDSHSAWFIVCAVVCGGWLVGILQKPSLDEIFRRQQRLRWSMWDILCLTTFTAMIWSIVPMIEQPFDLLCQMGPTLLGGWTLSLLAFEWAWRDRWTLGAFTAAVVIAPLACLLSLSVSPTGFDAASSLLWLISGPASVLAMQGLVTLLYAAYCRLGTAVTDGAGNCPNRSSFQPADNVDALPSGIRLATQASQMADA